MTFPKFTLQSPTPEVQSFYDKEGFAIFSLPELKSSTHRFLTQIQNLILAKKQKNDPKATVTETEMFTRDLVDIHKNNRTDFVHILDAAHTLPGFFGLCDADVIHQLLKKIGLQQTTMTMPPRLRLDFPNEDEFLQPDHQDHYYHEGDPHFVTIWFPLVSVTADMGALGIRPRSHENGLLPFRAIQTRPYFLLEKGPWQTQYPLQEVCLDTNEVVVFHMDLIHKSGLNRGRHPRVTVQLRYNDLQNPQYAEQGWPPSYRIVSRKDTHTLPSKKESS